MKLKFLLVTFVCLSACSLGNGQQKFSGTLELTEYNLGARSSGRLETLTVDEGSRVNKGDVLATLDRFDQAKKDYDRLVGLAKVGGASDQEVERAELNLEDQQVVAPVSGVVLLKLHDVGEMLTSGTPIVTLGNDANPWVRIFVPEGMINRLQIGDSAHLMFDGLSQAYQGHVVYIAPKAEFTPRNVQTKEERITQTFAVKVALDDKDKGLHPGVATDVYFDFSAQTKK